jgi:hypothetical protein
VRLTEGDPIPVEAAHEVHELLHTPPKSVELPHDERVASSEGVERTQEPRTGYETAARSVLVDLLAASHTKRLLLQVKALVSGRDPGIADEHIRSSGGRFSQHRGEPDLVRTGYENGF